MVLLFFILMTNIFRAIQEKYDKSHISIKTVLKLKEITRIHAHFVTRNDAGRSISKSIKMQMD